jgi:hypothetical protein
MDMKDEKLDKCKQAKNVGMFDALMTQHGVQISHQNLGVH